MSERSTCFPPNPLYDSQMGWEAITHLEFPICNLWSQQDNTLTQSRVLIKSYSQMKNLTAINSHNWNAYPERYGREYWSFSTMRESELHLLQPRERLRCQNTGQAGPASSTSPCWTWATLGEKLQELVVQRARQRVWLVL